MKETPASPGFLFCFLSAVGCKDRVLSMSELRDMDVAYRSPLINKIAFGMLAVSLLLVLRPYSGIRHDAILYLGQGFLKWQPGEFAHDLFFAYGGQAGFTVFPQLLAWLMERFPVADIFTVATFLGRVLYLVAAGLLVRTLFRENGVRTQMYALLAVLVMPSVYGGFFVLSYSEPFFTGRTLAEPLGLLALAALLSERWLLCAVLWLVAALLHPLQALAVWIVIWFWLVLQNRRWLLLLVPAVLVLLLASLGVKSLAFAALKYDAEWYSWIVRPNRLVFMLEWPAWSWLALLSDSFLLVLSIRYFSGRLQVFAKAVFWALICSCLASIVLADLLRLAFMTSLQLWRVQWVAHWFAMAALPLLAWSIYNREYGRERFLLLVACVVWAIPAGQVSPSPWLVTLVIPLFVFWGALVRHARPAFSRAMIAFVALGLVLGLVLMIVTTVAAFLKRGADLGSFRLDSMLLGHPLVLVMLLLGGGRAWARAGGAFKGVLLCGLSVLFIYSIYSWDSRGVWNRYVEERTGESNPFGVQLERGAQVYWEKELLAPWLLLRRASYFSEEQQAGLLFERKTAEEAYRRKLILQRLAVQADLCSAVGAVTGQPDGCSLDIYAVRDMCISAGHELSYIVLQTELPVPELGQWMVPKHKKDGQDVTFHLYSCSGVLENVARK